MKGSKWYICVVVRVRIDPNHQNVEASASDVVRYSKKDSKKMNLDTRRNTR